MKVNELIAPGHFVSGLLLIGIVAQATQTCKKITEPFIGLTHFIDQALMRSLTVVVSSSPSNFIT